MLKDGPSEIVKRRRGPKPQHAPRENPGNAIGRLTADYIDTESYGHQIKRVSDGSVIMQLQCVTPDRLTIRAN